MKAFSFNVTIASEALDCEVIEDTLRQALTDGLPDETLALVKADGVKEYSEQGWKVARNASSVSGSRRLVTATRPRRPR